jgi:methyltransferase (TIGR00027 family)
MDASQASRTALGTSLMRAAHTRSDRPVLVDDPWGDRLVLDREREAMCESAARSLSPDVWNRIAALGSPQKILDRVLRANPTYGMVIVRACYAEDALLAAVARGVRQYVIVGAGFDSFALRRPESARDVAVFEVDHPATQALKRSRLREAGVPFPEGLHFVAADLGPEPLDAALAHSPFRRGDPAFFSWLGVTVYLTREANLGTLRAIAAVSAPASEVVFSYIDQSQLDPGRETEAIRRLRARVAAAGEPWVSGFEPARLAGDLGSVGLRLVEDLDGPALHDRYCRGRDDGLTPGGFGHVARAEVAP